MPSMGQSLGILLGAKGAPLILAVAGVGIASGVLRIELKKRHMHGMVMLVDQIMYLVVGWIVGDYILQAASQIYNIISSF